MTETRVQQSLRVEWATDELTGIRVSGYRETDR